jgi:hypothetical protein
MSSSDNQEIFWIYQPYSLMTNLDLIPVKCMTLDQKMNAITRFFLLCILILLFLQVKNIYLFFFIGLIIIITVYLINYTMSSNTTKESFTPCFTDVNINDLLNYVHVPPPVNNARFNDPPPYIAPSHNIEDWKQSTLVQHSAINDNKGGYSLKTSGYKFKDASVNCGINSPYYSCDEQKLPYRICKTNTTPIGSCSPTTVDYKEEACGCNECVGQATNDIPKIIENILTPGNKIPVYKVGNPFSKKTCERKCLKGKSGPVDFKSDHCVASPGDLIEHCGYNPDKGMLAGMPHNQPMSVNDYFPTLKSYHQDLNTEIIDPSGVYTTTEINEPQMTNLGISFPQQFQPLETIENCNGDELIIRKNPRLYKPLRKIYDYGEITPDSIYDPRSDGYGDARRTYIDQVTGQPRFYYDDINAARESNFITRNKIDVYNFTNQTGIFDEKVNDNPLEMVKYQAHDAFINKGNDFRHSLQESLMRKGNEKARQQRLAPLRRDGRTRTMK